MNASQLHRFYCPHLAAGVNALDEVESSHAARVLRLRAGDEIELFDGRGGRAKGPITHLRRSEVLVEVAAVQQTPRPGAEVSLAFAVPKGKRLDWLLEKATELGAASLLPVEFERSVAEGAEAGTAKWQRWEAHCVAAAKQSGLDFLPQLHPLRSLADLLTDPPGSLRIMGDAAPQAPAAGEVFRAAAGQSVCLLVGPEGGLADRERQAALQAGFQPARVGTTTLRVETACLALLSVAAASRG